MPMHTIREITRLATMLAGLIAPWLRLGFVLASISCEHCRSSRNNPHCAPRHVIYYFDLLRTDIVVRLSLYCFILMSKSVIVDRFFYGKLLYLWAMPIKEGFVYCRGSKGTWPYEGQESGCTRLWPPVLRWGLVRRYLMREYD